METWRPPSKKITIVAAEEQLEINYIRLKTSMSQTYQLPNACYPIQNFMKLEIYQLYQCAYMLDKKSDEMK